jgi:hypothetical protein
MEFLEDFSIEKLGLIENDIATMMDKLDIFFSGLRIDDKSIEDVQKRQNHIYSLCKLEGSSKKKTKKSHLKRYKMGRKYIKDEQFSLPSMHHVSNAATSSVHMST